MRKPKSSASSKLLPSSTPTSRPACAGRPLTKAELENVKVIRGYGVVDLKKYILKIKKNIGVFKEAIDKEITEMRRVKNMIKVLENDIKDADEKLHH